jgi:hypothetical protein
MSELHLSSPPPPTPVLVWLWSVLHHWLPCPHWSNQGSTLSSWFLYLNQFRTKHLVSNYSATLSEVFCDFPQL